jgi:hypothetical protein
LFVANHKPENPNERMKKYYQLKWNKLYHEISLSVNTSTRLNEPKAVNIKSEEKYIS